MIPVAPFALHVYRCLAGWYATGQYGGLVADDAANDWAVSKWVTALCAPGEDAYRAFADDVWLDPELTPDSFVHYVAVGRGVDPKGVDLDTLRAWCADGGPTRQRGSDPAMELRVKQVLTGTKTVRFYPATDPAFPGVESVGNTLIRTRADETPGGVGSVVAAARDRAAAVWQMVHAQVLTGDAIDELDGNIEDLSGDIEDL